MLKSYTLYKEWNEKINVISRKDIDTFYEKHFLHSLAIAKFVKFKKGTRILDIGTGGGFPGIPLAIFFPEVQFHLVDSIAKKISVVVDIVQQLGLENVKAECLRCETLTEKFDFITSRAVAPAAELIRWNEANLSTKNRNDVPNGFLFLKGGALSEELGLVNKKKEVISLTDYFNEPFFEAEKKLVFIHGK